MYCQKTLSENDLKNLNRKAYEIRRWCLIQTVTGNAGHPGGTLSAADIMADLYFKDLNITPENVDSEDRDIFILSKAHAAPVLYASLALKGIIPMESLAQYCVYGGIEGHTDALATPGVEMSGGSLGLGLSYAVGVADALKRKQQYNRRVVCVLGDGELAEGTIWEASMLAAQRGLDNLIVFVDYNKVQAKAFVHEEVDMSSLVEKFRAFRWNVQEIDGHDIEEIHRAYYYSKYVLVGGKPSVIIANTCKGKGLECAEFNFKWHARGGDIYPELNDRLRELAENYGYEPEDVNVSILNPDDSIEAAFEEE